MTGARLGSTVAAGTFGLALGVGLPALYAWVFGLGPGEAATIKRELMGLSPAMAFAVGGVAGFGLRVSARSFRGEASLEERSLARVAAHRFPGRAAIAVLVAGFAVSLAAALDEVMLRHFTLRRSGTIALLTMAAVVLASVSIYLYARSSAAPLLAHLPEEPLARRSRAGVRGLITFAVIGMALASLLPAALVLGQRLDTTIRDAGRARVAIEAAAVQRIVDGLEGPAARVILDAAPLGGGIESSLRLERRPGAGGVAVPILVALLLMLSAVAAALVGGLFAREVEALTTQVAAVVASSEPIRLEAAGAAEVSAVAASINALLDRVARHHVDAFLAVEKLEEARHLKSQFLANMSHDLRSPLNSILGFSELLLRGLDGEVGDAERAHLVEIQRAGRRLLRLINEILDTAKCESGKMTIEAQSVTPAEIVSQAIQEVRRGPDPSPEVDFTTELRPGMEPIEVDPVLLSQAVAHLIGYAFGAVSRGRVHLSAGERKTPRGRWFVVEVEYSGALPEGDREQVFVGFRRVGPGDLGLALPLARRLAELHGGTVAFAEGDGAKLVLSVPFAPQRERLGVLRRKAPTAALPS